MAADKIWSPLLHFTNTCCANTPTKKLKWEYFSSVGWSSGRLYMQSCEKVEKVVNMAIPLWQMQIHNHGKCRFITLKMLKDADPLFWQIQIHKLKNAGPQFWQLKIHTVIHNNLEKCKSLHKSDKHWIHNLEAYRFRILTEMQIQNLEKLQIHNPGAFGWRGPQDFPQGLALQAG